MVPSIEATNLIDEYKLALVAWATEVAKGAIVQNDRKIQSAEQKVHRARFALDSHVARMEHTAITHGDRP